MLLMQDGECLDATEKLFEVTPDPDVRGYPPADQLGELPRKWHYHAALSGVRQPLLEREERLEIRRGSVSDRALRLHRQHCLRETDVGRYGYRQEPGIELGAERTRARRQQSRRAF